jgi:hypothetical protein
VVGDAVFLMHLNAVAGIMVPVALPPTSTMAEPIFGGLLCATYFFLLSHLTIQVHRQLYLGS